MECIPRPNVRHEYRCMHALWYRALTTYSDRRKTTVYWHACSPLVYVQDM